MQLDLICYSDGRFGLGIEHRLREAACYGNSRGPRSLFTLAAREAAAHSGTLFDLQHRDDL